MSRQGHLNYTAATQCHAARVLRARSTAFCAFVACVRRAARETVTDRPTWLERSVVSPPTGICPPAGPTLSPVERRSYRHGDHRDRRAQVHPHGRGRG